MLRTVALAAVFSCSAAAQYFAGAIAGLATLSADGASRLAGPVSLAASAYNPQNGAALNLFAGRDLTDYLAIQGNYIWNRNQLRLTSVGSSGAGYQETRSSSQHSAIADLLLYFRNRASWVRPYLSAGVGFVHLRSDETAVAAALGAASLPPTRFSKDKPALRVAVGIDLVIRRGFVFRYSFSETNSGNPISEQLAPPGQRWLKNFQNLFGVLYRL